MGNLTSKGKHPVKVESHPHTNTISKPIILRGREYRIFEMHLKLRDQQLEATLCVCVCVCVCITISNPRGNHKPKIYNRCTHTKEKESKHTLKKVLKSQEYKEKERKETYKNKSKTINKMAIRTYISIITLNVHELNAATKRHTLAEQIYAVYKRPTSYLAWPFLLWGSLWFI